MRQIPDLGDTQIEIRRSHFLDRIGDGKVERPFAQRANEDRYLVSHDVFSSLLGARKAGLRRPGAREMRRRMRPSQLMPSSSTSCSRTGVAAVSACA